MLSMLLLLLLIISRGDAFETAEGKKNGKRKKSHGGARIDPMTYYIGLWEGLDPEDGTNMQRSIVPVQGEHNSFRLTGRLEVSQVCKESRANPDCDTGGITAPTRVSASLSALGSVNPEDGQLTFPSVSLTCFGDSEPILSGLPVTFVPLGVDLVSESVPFRPELPNHFHRVGSSIFEDVYW